MRQTILTLGLIVAAALALGCGQGPGSAAVAEAGPAASTPPAASQAAPVSTAPTRARPGSTAPRSTAPGGLELDGSREETERFIHHFRSIRLTPEQERIKVAALSAIPAPCCADNPLSTCCCPCNMAKAAWGLSAWLITEKGYGVEQVREAAVDWLAAANPDGFTGNACYTGGCARAIHDNGCGGMDEGNVL